jgi:hypothetical protein
MNLFAGFLATIFLILGCGHDDADMNKGSAPDRGARPACRLQTPLAIKTSDPKAGAGTRLKSVVFHTPPSGVTVAAGDQFQIELFEIKERAKPGNPETPTGKTGALVRLVSSAGATTWEGGHRKIYTLPYTFSQKDSKTGDRYVYATTTTIGGQTAAMRIEIKGKELRSLEMNFTDKARAAQNLCVKSAELGP